MTSRLRGPSAVKDTPRAAPFAKDHFHHEPEVHSVGRSCKNGGRGNRYHFGMSKHDNKAERNGRECGKEEAGEDNADLLYRKSKQHFGTWDIKDIVQDDGGARGSRRQDLGDSQLTNGKFRSEPVGAKLDKSQQDRLEYRDEGYVGSLPREDRQRGESVERELNGSHRSRRKEPWEEDTEPRSRGRPSKIGKGNDSKDDAAHLVDERDVLLKEIENLAVDGTQSPDRRIQAMIERLKSREESKLRSRREQRSVSPEKDARGRSRSGGRSDLRPITDNSLDNPPNDRGRKLKDDREDEHGLGESKLQEKPDRGENAGRCDRSIDRRSKSVERQNEIPFFDNDRESRRDDGFRKRSDTYGTERTYRRRSREDEEDQSRPKDNSKRRSYIYEGSPEDFDVKIQKYDRALLEPRRDLDTHRRGSPRDPKEHDREPITKKSSFRVESKKATSKDRESSLTRKTSFKEQDNEAYKKHISKTQPETAVRYFGKDQENPCRTDSFKDTNLETGRKGFFRVQDDEYGRIYMNDQRDDVERKASFKEHTGGVSRIVLRNFDDESGRSNSLRNTSEDSERRNSFKEKSVDFGGISYKNRVSDSERKNSLRNEDGDFGRAFYHDYENNIDRKTANDRYIEFGKISFKTQDDDLRASPPKEENNEAVVRTSSFKERDVSSKRRASLRNRGRETPEKKFERHSRPLTPPKKDESESRENNSKDPKNFCAKSWYESNRIFSAKYLRDHGKLRSAPEGQLDSDASPEREFSILQDARGAIEEIANNGPEERSRFEMRGGRTDAVENESRFSSTRERNGTTIIRIRSSEDSSGAERRRRRRPAQEVCAVRRRRYEAENNDDSDDDDDDDGNVVENRRRRTRRDGGIVPQRTGNTGGETPSRTIWNYREGVWHFHESIAFDRSFMVQRREAIFINRWRR